MVDERDGTALSPEMPSLLEVAVKLGHVIHSIRLNDGSTLVIIKGPLGKAEFYRWNPTLGVLEIVRPYERGY